MNELQIGLISVFLSSFFLLFFVPTFHLNNYISLLYSFRLLPVATFNLVFFPKRLTFVAKTTKEVTCTN